MKKTLILDTPLLINGKEIKELDYDANEITALQFSEACMKASELSKNSSSLTLKLKENDYGLHLYLGFAAIIAINPEIDLKDLERIKGNDVLKITDIGTVFIFRKSEANSQEKKYAQPCETTPDTSIQVSEKSENNA